MSVKAKAIVSLVCNLTVLIATSVVTVLYFTVGQNELESAYRFLFFTTYSNYLAALAAGLVAVCDVLILRGKMTTIPRAITLLKYAGVITLTLTFITVVVLLIPTYGVARLWGGTGFHMHFAAPVLTFISFMFFEPHCKIRLPETLWGVLPVVIYGLVYYAQVMIFKAWPDFYTFNRGGKWYISMSVIFIGSYLMCLFVRFLRNMLTDKKQRLTFSKK